MDLLVAVREAAVRLRDAGSPVEWIAAGWHATDVGEASALGLARLAGLADAPAYLVAADGFGRARRHLDGVQLPADGDGVYPERISTVGASAEVSETALVDLAYLVVAGLAKVARQTREPDLLLACSRAHLAVVDARDALSRVPGHVDDVR
jgi:hypothetical protein